MKIKKFSAIGFKSFMEKLDIPIPSGISAIVGPNGCGKSNIVDALRWVIDHIDPKPANIADSALLLSPPKDGYIVLAGGSDHSAARARIPYTGDSFDEAKAVHAHSVNAIVKTAPAPKQSWRERARGARMWHGISARPWT